MRVPHYLIRRPGGYAFRITVPIALRPAIGRKAFTRMIYAGTIVAAADRARVLALHYSWAFAAIEAGAMAGDEDVVKDGLGALYGGTAKPFKIKDGTNGGPPTFESEPHDTPATLAFGADRHDKAMATWERVELAKAEAAAHVNSEAYQRAVASINAPAPPPAGPPLKNVIAQYLAAEGKEMSADTRDARERAFRAVVAFPLIGPHKPVNEIERADAAAWLDAVRAGGATKATAQHYGTHLKMLFKWLESKGRLPHGAARATWEGLIQITSREKRRRREKGGKWRPFTADELRLLFDPANFAQAETEHVRWGMVLGLYTGARVGEIAQIYLRDFVVEGGVRCVKITNESDGQQLKSDASDRLVPIHPDLIRLGLDDLIARRVAAGEQRLFAVALDLKAGVGSTISKGMTNYLGARGIVSRKPDDQPAEAGAGTLRGRVGFHSFRSTVIQQLQGRRDLPEERRRAFLGHEAAQGDAHASYMRPWLPKEIRPLVKGLTWGKWLDADALRPLLASGAPPGRGGKDGKQRSPYAIQRAKEREAEKRAKKG